MAEVLAETPVVDDGLSTYERIGGLSTIDAICDVMYRHVMADERLTEIYQETPYDIDAIGR